MGKSIKIGIAILIGLLALYNSVTIESLKKDNANRKTLDTVSETTAADFFKNTAPDLEAWSYKEFVNGIQGNAKTFIQENGQKLGISEDYYFMVDCKGKVQKIMDEFIIVKPYESQQNIKIATDFIFGNAIREASGNYSIGDYSNTMDFNTISIVLNDHVRDLIIPRLLSEISEGSELYVKGAVKVPINGHRLEDLRMIPVLYEKP